MKRTNEEPITKPYDQNTPYYNANGLNPKTPKIFPKQQSVVPLSVTPAPQPISLSVPTKFNVLPTPQPDVKPIKLVDPKQLPKLR